MRRVSVTTTAVLLAACAALAALAATSPMPYRPGYGLGSWIPQPVVESMRKEAERRVEIMTLEAVEAEARSAEREIRLIADSDDAANDKETRAEAHVMLQEIRQSRRDMMKKKMTAVKGWLNHLVDSAKPAADGEKTKDSSATGKFTTFGSRHQSPVDWTKSSIKPEDRAFDSLNIGVHYVRAENMGQEGAGELHASRVGRELKSEDHSVTGRVTNVQREAARLAADKTVKTAAHHDIAGTLLVTAFATHRMVKQFGNVDIDADKLWGGWNAHYDDDKIPDPLNQHESFKKAIEVEKKRDVTKPRNQVCMVSELFMGSVLVGMVHFVTNATTVTKNQQDATRLSQKFDDDIADNVRQAQKAATQVGSTSIALEEARKMAKLGSSAGLDVQFDLVSIGYIPKLATDPMQQAISQFATFDPAQFKVPSMMADAPGIAGLAAVQSNMAAVIDATVTAISKEQASKDVLSDKSLMDAFTDFTDAAKRGDAIGAPIGMNIVDFNKLDVMSTLANKYLNTGIKLGVDV
eukprot:CAMPEP_0174839572 /NCGR_PEP_ID=MMETSP1114-20130205/8127_1 /TAXON_ID=312471 /ORGANISM="Neobodo designis, Strain CCAP 1951/1" /LENGTH=521 /DNA_ID=CAMNT_0016073697 /DNA_START=155 /DNA_END=1720 /DNA_ORIENTATION=-